jgi:chemotaxis protein MotB
VGASVGLGPWVVTLGVAAVSGFVGYWLYHRGETAQASLSETRGQVESLRKEAASASDKAAEASAAVARTKQEYATREMHLRSQYSELEKRMKEKEAAADELAAKLQDIISSDEGELVDQGGGQLTLQLMDKVLFRSGEAQLTANGKKVLRAVGGALNDFPEKQVWVQGHTDDVPIARTNKTFKSNWELSAARALNVVHFLQDEVEVDPARLAAVAFSQYRPVSRRKKARNRRIEIVLFPKQVRVIQDD